MNESTCSLPLLLLPVFHLLLFSSLVSSTPFFGPVSILLNCGASSDHVDDDKRRWTNDSTTHFGPSNLKSSFAAQAFSAEIPSVPYQTARIFASASSYNFTALPQGRHFVRLHFFPAVYNDRDPKNAFFSVTTGPYTLLSNFSPSITALALTQAYIISEFFITAPSGSLVLTFTPSQSSPDSFAFINGIEVVSSPELFRSFAFNPSSTVGQTDQIFRIQHSEVLQTVVRLNVGGAYVSPSSDSGLLFRTWYDDTPYVYGAALGVSYYRDPNISIQYSDAFPDYIAPPDVYGTARSMGPYASVNNNYNLQWNIAIDNGFRYWVRLHFCEIQSKINNVNQRVFDIYVSNMTADLKFDVLDYASKKVNTTILTGVAVYRDYIIEVPPVKGSERSDMWITLHPDAEIQTNHADAILNGLEVFKVNDSSGNLAGPNPDLPRAPSPKNSSPVGRHGGGHTLVIAGAVGGIAAALVAGACTCCLLCRARRKKREKGSDGSASTWVPLSPYVRGKNGKSTLIPAENSLVDQSNASNAYCRHFRFSEMTAATNNFDDALLLGRGGFGKVYIGEIDGGTKVAIKRGNQLAEQGVREFKNEIEMLSKLRHRHLVSLIGYCDDSSQMILVYNYMAHGSLRQHLYGTNQPPLSWRLRLEICIGAAKGLHYLHAGATYTLIHRDVKTANILLDVNWVAKVSDFGLSRMGSSLDCSHVSTGVKGTFGYFDPEYFRFHRLTEKPDVYSFGVVLLEILCARPAIDKSRPMEEIGLADWGLRSMRLGRTERIIDPFLEGKIALECLHKFAETAERCLAEQSADRPSMANVVSSLELALFLQISGEEEKKGEGLAPGPSMTMDGDDEEVSISSMVWHTDDERSSSTYAEQATMDSRSM